MGSEQDHEPGYADIMPADEMTGSYLDVHPSAGMEHLLPPTHAREEDGKSDSGCEPTWPCLVVMYSGAR